MTRDDVTARLTDVMLDTFDADEIVYRDELTARDVPGWDSLSNIRLMVAVEQAFGIKLTVGQWSSLENVGQLADLVAAKV